MKNIDLTSFLENKTTVCKTNLCTGCGACSAICPCGCINIIDNLSSLNSIIGKGCVSCNLCHSICPQNNIVEFKETIRCFQGWSNSESTRYNSSSGGVAMELFRTALKLGYSVYSCRFEEGNFRICKIEKESDLLYFSGSKYVKSKMNLVFSKIKRDLLNNYVLFLGLPCQVAGLKKYVPNNLTKKLITVDLICHGTPSHKLLEMFINETGNCMSELDDIKFRRKNVSSDESFSYIGEKGIVDCYSLAFQHSLSFLESCYSCRYAKKDRVSDITLGDSWGTNLEGIEKGISLILCQTDAGLSLVEASNLVLNNIDYRNALVNNSQLSHPSVPHKNRFLFFNYLSQGLSFKSSVNRCLKKGAIRQNLKRIMIILKLLKPSYSYQISVRKKNKDDNY